MTVKEHKIEPCPNRECHRASYPHIAEFRGVGETAGVMYAGRCLSCFMVGPKMASQSKARELWNALPRPSTSDAAVEVLEERQKINKELRQAATPGSDEHETLCRIGDELNLTLNATVLKSLLKQPADSSGFAATPEQAEAMADAIWQLLDDMQFQDIGGYVCGGAIQQAKEAIEPFADHLELEPHERAKPYGGYAAGVAKCMEVVERWKKTSLSLSDEYRNSDEEKSSRYAIRYGMCVDVLSELRALAAQEKQP
ncbi:hypothetical protein HBA54_28090 [Pelagibius litoralis]|uniref:Uncharacterized protein n=1 Tax=Pelagibius litoralis TaxID=374515 RepID=A0A967F3B2_9PROT|nr:hypothetical protein [Pelagibius litoralis]NIA72453.1 hypothetical protein [Pelagibius litoralis]